jgi:hypothetical protein
MISQETELIILSALIDIDVPSLWTAIIPRTPAIASLFQLIFEIKGRLFSPNPNGSFAGALQQE